MRDLVVSGDGQVAVVLSTDDPLGTNPDRSVELFRVAPDGSGFAPAITLPADVEIIGRPLIGDDGSRIGFLSNADASATVFVSWSDLVPGDNPGFEAQLTDDDASLRNRLCHSLDHDGQRLAFAAPSTASTPAPGAPTPSPTRE